MNNNNENKLNNAVRDQIVDQFICMVDHNITQFMADLERQMIMSSDDKEQPLDLVLKARCKMVQGKAVIQSMCEWTCKTKRQDESEAVWLDPEQLKLEI